MANNDDRTFIALIVERFAQRRANNRQIRQCMGRLAALGGDRNQLVREFLESEMGGLPHA